MDDFIEKHSADNQVFQKNVDLLNAVESITSHYTLNAPETGIFGQRP